MISPADKLITLSVQDLYQDFDELIYLLTSQKSRLNQFVVDVAKVKLELRPSVYICIIKKTKQLILQNEKYEKLACKYRDKCKKKMSLSQIDELYNKKLTLFEIIRIHYNETAALITSIDWQSPSFLHSRLSMAGKQTGRIVGTENDYKRDQHLDELIFQNKFKGEYIDSFFRMSIQIFATNSGMAAFTTILNFLQMNKKIAGPILIGKSVYFENKVLVKKIFDNVVEVDETNTQEVLRKISTIRPSIVILDSLSNSIDIVVPDLLEIMQYLMKIKKHTYLLIDNTGLSISFQVLKKTIGKSAFLHPIVFESLNKYYQFGMDRSTGGIFWIHGKEGYNLFKAREFSGTNISDVSTYTIPTPNRKFLEKRLARLGRNAKILAEHLQKHIETNKTIANHIVYPGLSNHQSFSWTKNNTFHGCFFTIAFKKNYQKVAIYKKFVENVVHLAKKQNVDIVSGTSFGFNTTRIYLTALHSEFGNPFVRISVGTEPLYYIDKISRLFTAVLDEMNR